MLGAGVPELLAPSQGSSSSKFKFPTAVMNPGVPWGPRTAPGSLVSGLEEIGSSQCEL